MSSHVRTTRYSFPKQILGSRCNPVGRVVLGTDYTAAVVVDMMIAGIEVEVLEKYIPWVGSCGL